MPELPTLTVTQAQMDVILEAFKNYYGTTTAEETATAYRRQLARMIIGTVRGYQLGLIQKQADAAALAKSAEIDAFFPDPNTIP